MVSIPTPNDNNQSKSSSDDMTSSSEDEEEEQQEKLIDGKLQKLLLDLETTPYQYDKHLELIQGLRVSTDLDQLRKARENMSTIYPLSEELWLEWFEDELPLAAIPQQKHYLLNKFEVAVKDYASVKVWHEYCQFVMNNIDSPADIQRAREVFEKALTSVGLHVTEGSSIWAGYREFELAILDSYQQLSESGDGGAGMQEKVDSQIERIGALYKRELSVPLLSVDSVYKVYEDWLCEPVPAETKRLYERASDKLSLLLEYEEKLSEAEGNKLPEYLAYVEYEMKGGDPARIQSIFERAIKDNCLHYELWDNYTKYMDFKLKIPSLAVQVHKRAVRNCPWVSQIWTNYLKALERSGTTVEGYLKVFDESLKCGFAGKDPYLQIWFTKCDYYRRGITDWEKDEAKIGDLRTSFKEAVDYMDHYFRGSSEALLQEWAFVEAKFLNNVPGALQKWDAILKKTPRDPVIWGEYFKFLSEFADIKTTRKAFQRAIQISFEDPQFIADEFLKFERRFGSLADLDNAQQKVDVHLKAAKVRAEKDKTADEDVVSPPKNRKKKYKFGDDGIESNKGQKKKFINFEKEGSSSKRGRNSGGSPTSQPEKKKQFVEKGKGKEVAQKGGDHSKNQNQNLDKYNNPTTVKDTNEDMNMEEPDGGVSTTEEAPSASKKDEKPITDENNTTASGQTLPPPPCGAPTDTSTDTTESDDVTNAPRLVDFDFSVFLSNMLYSAQEGDLRDMFSACGDIEKVQVVRGRDGKSKGYAYLQFKDKQSITQALKLDRQPLLDRPVFVSKCTDKKENPTQFKYSTTLDKRTLYVTNLPFEATSDQVSAHFSQAGVLKEVRLVTNRSGKSKGFAYVEYELESAATSALLSLDKQILMGRPVNVHLSKPPSRKQNTGEKQQVTVNKPATKAQEVPGGRGKAKTQVCLVPRAVLKKAPPTKANETSSSNETKTDEKTSDVGVKPGAMSNDDFRKFLLK